MKRFFELAVTVVLSGGIALAQTCPVGPGSVCLVPSQSQQQSQVTTYMSAATPMTSVVTVPYSGSMMAASPYCVTPSSTTSYLPGQQLSAVPVIMYPMNFQSAQLSAVPTTCPIPMTTYSAPQISADTACLSSQLSALRGDVRSLQGSIRAASIEMRGQDLVNRMNTLMANEALFRQELAANPNLPNAQARALALSQQADALNRDIASFNRELSLVPVDQRPFIASELNTFTVAYWDPALQRFASYNTQFAQNAASAYQPALAVNPWLTNWQTSYQASLNSIAMTPQTYASVNWWSPMGTTTMTAGIPSSTGIVVLGTTESFPTTAGTTTMIPQGTVIYVPSTAY